MSDKFYVGLDVTSFSDNGQYKPISRVTLRLDDENQLTAGDDTGMEISADCPHATQEIVDALYTALKGHKYQPYSAGAANIDPAAELGDGVTVGGLYSVISRITDDGSGYPSLEAPGQAELEDEYPDPGPMTKEFNRKIAQTRSLISKTANEIRLEVKQINSDLTENYAKLSVVSDMISSEVRAELYTDDVDEDGNPIKVAKYSTVEQTAESITAAINGLDGKYLEVSLLPEGMFVTDESGNYTKISGGVIETDSLQLKGVIAFGDLSDYEAKQQEIDDAADAADEATKTAKAIANGTYAGTFINETSIYSPTIYGNEFNVISDVKAGGSFNIHGYFDEELYHFLKIDYADGGTNPFITFSSPDGATASWAFGDTLFGGNCDFNSASVSFNYSTVDFSRATKVTFDPGTVEGLGSVTAVFG